MTFTHLCGDECNDVMLLFMTKIKAAIWCIAAAAAAAGELFSVVIDTLQVTSYGI